METKLDGCKYEFENQMTNVDWLAMVSDSVLDHGLDMNNLFRWHAAYIGEDPEYSQTRQEAEQMLLKGEKEWEEVAEYGRYLVNFNVGLSKAGSKEHKFDLNKFLVNHAYAPESKENLQSIFHSAIN